MPNYNRPYIPTVSSDAVSRFIDAAGSIDERASARAADRDRAASYKQSALDRKRKEESLMNAKALMTDQFTTIDLPAYKYAENNNDLGKMAEGYARLLNNYTGGRPGDPNGAIRARVTALVPQIGEMIASVRHTMNNPMITIVDKDGKPIKRTYDDGTLMTEGRDNKPVIMKLSLNEALQKAPHDYDILNTLMKGSSREGRIYLEQAMGGTNGRSKFHYDEVNRKLLDEEETRGWYTLKDEIARKQGMTLDQIKKEEYQKNLDLSRMENVKAVAKYHNEGLDKAKFRIANSNRRIAAKSAISISQGIIQQAMERAYLLGPEEQPKNAIEAKDKNDTIDTNLKAAVDMEAYIEANSPAAKRKAQLEENKVKASSMLIESAGLEVKLLNDKRRIYKEISDGREEYEKKVQSYDEKKGTISHISRSEKEKAFTAGLDINNTYIRKSYDEIKGIIGFFGVFNKEYLEGIENPAERRHIINKKKDLGLMRTFFKVMYAEEMPDEFGGTSDDKYKKNFRSERIYSKEMGGSGRGPAYYFNRMSPEAQAYLTKMEELRGLYSTVKTEREAKDVAILITLERRKFFKGPISVDKTMTLATIASLTEEWEKTLAAKEKSLASINGDIAGIVQNRNQFNAKAPTIIEHRTSKDGKQYKIGPDGKKYVLRVKR